MTSSVFSVVDHDDDLHAFHQANRDEIADRTYSVRDYMAR